MMAMDNAEEIMQILERFTRLKQKEIPKELDDYLGYVAKTGDTVFKWSSLKYLFREKLLNVIKHFHDTSPRIEEIPQYPNVDPFNYESMKSALLERLDLFNAAPFTIQRLCELLIDPRKQYSRIDKFMRALEKNILVVSTVEPGCKRSESENGDSLDSVVNGDLSLDVNVDIDMETEALFSLETTNGNSGPINKMNLEITNKEGNKAKISHAADDEISPQPKKAKLELDEERNQSGEEKLVINSSGINVELSGLNGETVNTVDATRITGTTKKENTKDNESLETRTKETLEAIESSVKDEDAECDQPKEFDKHLKSLKQSSETANITRDSTDSEIVNVKDVIKETDTLENKTGASNFESDKQKNLTVDNEEKTELKKVLGIANGVDSVSVAVKVSEVCNLSIANEERETIKGTIPVEKESSKTNTPIVISKVITKFTNESINEEALKEDVTNAKIEYEKTEASKSRTAEDNEENVNVIKPDDTSNKQESVKQETSNQANEENPTNTERIVSAPKTDISQEVKKDSKEATNEVHVLKSTTDQDSIQNETTAIKEVKQVQQNFTDWLNQKPTPSELENKENKGVEEATANEINTKISIDDTNATLFATTASGNAENIIETIRTDVLEMPKEIPVVASTVIEPAATIVPDLALNDQLMAVEDTSPVINEVVMDELTSTAPAAAVATGPGSAPGPCNATANQLTADEAELNSAIRSIASDDNALGIISPPTAMATDDDAITSILLPNKINVDDPAGMEIDDTSQEEAMDQ